MLNQVVVCGSLVGIEENTDTSLKLTVAVPRPYKNVDGIYENDNVTCISYGSRQQIKDFNLKKGDIIGAKGRLQVKENEQIFVAERVTFLSSHKKEEE